LAANAVAAGNIQSGAVTTTKLDNGAVTDAKIDTVSGGKVFGDINTRGIVTAGGGFNTTNNISGQNIVAIRDLSAGGTVGARNVHADGSIFAGEGIGSSGYISTSTNIHAGGSIHTDTFVFAEGHIATRGLVSADGGFSTTNLIYAGGSIAALGQINTRDVLTATKGISTDGPFLAGGGITTSNNIHAYGSIHGEGSLFAGAGITTSNNVHAYGSIHADSFIYSADHIATSGHMSAVGNMYAASFVNASDRNLKENLAPVDSQEVLERVRSLPISRWSFKSDATTRHIGPMAQDFTAAFNVGEDDQHIATVDADGVALAAIQGLHALVLRKDAEIADLKKRLETLEKAVLKQHGGAQ
jgi:hypothetical protein